MDHENTFGDLEADGRYKKLERDLKVAFLNKVSRKNTYNKNLSAMPSTITSCISSINGDSLDFSFVSSSLQGSRVGSEVLASSRNLGMRKKMQNFNPEIIATSSVKQYDGEQNNNVDRIIMPPPVYNSVYRTSEKQQSRIITPSNCNDSALILHRTSSKVKDFTPKNDSNYAAINTHKREFTDSFGTKVDTTNNLMKIDRVFTKWRVTLNSRDQLTIKGTLECSGRVVRSKPVVKRVTATCVESIFKYRYGLQGNITDEKNELPDYIRGKFYNGFPDDWENVYQIWTTFVSQGSKVTFRWPTPITDSDDDLKSGITELTYVASDKRATKPYETIKSTKQLSISSITKSSEKKKKYPNYTCDLPTHEENYLYGKAFASNTKKDVSSTLEMKNADNFNKQSIKTSVTPSCSFDKTNQLDNISQDDMLNIVINNLNDKDCSSYYIKQIMDKLLPKLLISPTLINYFQESIHRMIELKDNSDSTSRKTPKSTTIPLQQIFICNKDNHVNTDKVEDRIRQENHIQPFDLDSGNIKYNKSDPVQLLSVRNIRSEHADHKNSDESESETYTGIRKIPIERVFRTIQLSRKRHKRKRKVKKITIYPDIEICHANPECNTKICEFADHTKVPKTNMKRNLLVDESCASISEDEERLEKSIQKYYKTNPTFTQRSQVMIAPNNQKSAKYIDTRENANVDKELTLMKNEMWHKTQEGLRSQAAYINYNTNSNDRKMTLTNKQEDNIIISVSHSNPSLNIINTEHNTNSLKEPLGEVHKGITNQTSEIVKDKSKPTIIDSVPINLNFKIDENFVSVMKPKQSHDSNVDVKAGARHCMNVGSMKEESYKRKFTSRTSTPLESSTIAKNLYSSIIDNNERDISHNDFTHNDNIKMDSINSFNSDKLTTKQSKQPKNNKAGNENNPKILSAWTPKIVFNSISKSKLGLIFEGQLHNEAGHIVHRKFSTDIVLKRISATLVETVNHEFYELRGCVNDNKHVIPKELAEQCRNGCPSKIEEFCIRWTTLQAAKLKKVGIQQIAHNALIDSIINVPVSSRGRKRLPLLSYWEGERVHLKGNSVFYDPGNSQESSLTSLSENSKQILQSNCKSETIGNIKRSKKFGKSRKDINGKRRTVQQTYSSSDSSQKNVSLSTQKYMHCDANTNPEKLSKYTMNLRKRQKIDDPNKIPCMERKLKYDTISIRSPATKRQQNVMCTYYKNISLQEDFLSEDQISQI